MKRLLLLPVLGCVLLLAGCAGVSGDFECDATTSDRCMTMGQANQKARQQSDAAVGKPAAGTLPGLVNLPVQAPATRPLPTVAAPPPMPRPATVAQVSTSRPFAPANSPSASLVTPAGPACSPLRCDSAGQVHAQRTPEKIAYVWVAPWVDTDDVFHQPGRVSFVTDAARWQLPQSVN